MTVSSVSKTLLPSGFSQIKTGCLRPVGSQFTTPLSTGFTKPGPGKFFSPSNNSVRIGTSASQIKATRLDCPSVRFLQA